MVEKYDKEVEEGQGQPDGSIWWLRLVLILGNNQLDQNIEVWLGKRRMANVAIDGVQWCLEKGRVEANMVAIAKT